MKPRSMAAAFATSSIKYKPLWWVDEIRLVILEPGSGSDPIRCRLKHTEFGRQNYEALSYEWGNPNENLEITVNNEPLYVRQNLQSALVHVRTDRPRVLWIDALCINQADVSERNHQVRLMGRIYSEADDVVVWLGPAKNDSGLVIDALKRLRGLCDEVGEDHIYVTNPKQQHPQHTVKRLSLIGRSCEFMLDDTETESLCKIATRTYWHRMWIIQEIQQARSISVYCGSDFVRDSAFLQLDRILSISPVSKIEDFSMSLALLLLRQRYKVPMDLPTWLYFCLQWSCVCTEPRDIIYALLGISSDLDIHQLMPDYAKPVVEVYKDVLALLDKLWHDDSDRGQPKQKTRLLLARRLNLTKEEEELGNAVNRSMGISRFERLRNWWRQRPKGVPALGNRRFQRPRATSTTKAVQTFARISSRLTTYAKRVTRKGKESIAKWEVAAISFYVATKGKLSTDISSSKAKIRGRFLLLAKTINDMTWTWKAAIASRVHISPGRDLLSYIQRLIEFVGQP